MPADKKTNAILLDNQSGFVLVMAMLILLALAILGISTTKDSQIGLLVAGNDKISKQTFFRAEAGVELGSRMIEENVGCITGFTAGGLASLLNTSGITVANPSFWKNSPSWETTPTLPATSTSLDILESDCTLPKPANNSCVAARAFSFANQDGWTSNIAVAGTTKYSAGSAIQMIAGYEGKGKGAAAGGGTISYTLVSQALGATNSLSEVEILWRHMIGQEGECNY